jgi:hypothetical protein
MTDFATFCAYSVNLGFLSSSIVTNVVSSLAHLLYVLYVLYVAFRLSNFGAFPQL